MIEIFKGDSSHMQDCIESLYASELTSSYFQTKEYTEKWVKEGIERDEIFMARKEGVVIGFMRVDLKGAFATFPLLRVIAVKDIYRNRGLGKKMLEYFEKISFETSDKLFLLVSEFNGNAKRLYERLDYKEIGLIPGLYKKEYSEYLMMKVK